MDKSGADAAELLADLDALDALFASEQTWTQGELGRMCDGSGTRDVYAACKWCISGGAMRVVGSEGSPRWRRLLRALEAVAEGRANSLASIVVWNDTVTRTFTDVKKLIADARARVSAAYSPKGVI